MGLFGRKKRRDDDGEEPTLGEAWRMLGDRLDLAVDERDDEAVMATGVVRGRPVTVAIEGGTKATSVLAEVFGRDDLGNRSAKRWRTSLTVGCNGPAHPVGLITSAVDVHDPAWNPRVYDPRQGRKVTTDSTELAARISAPLHEKLMTIHADVTLAVTPDAVRLDDTGHGGKDLGYVGGCVIHQHPVGPPQPWPERALVGPPWWIDLLCDVADAVDGGAPPAPDTP